MLCQKLNYGTVGFTLTGRGMDESHELSLRNLL